MSSIRPPFDTTNIQSVLGIELELPDARRALTDPIIRPNIARYANSKINLSRISGAAGISIHSPGNGCVRRVALDALTENNDELINQGITELLEISLLPFNIEPILREINGGIPSFYFGISDGDLELFADDDFVFENQLIGTSSDFYFGAIFQDRLCLEPWGWAEIIANALNAIVAPAVSPEATAWTDFISALYPVGNNRIIKILDHVGQVHSATDFQIELNGQIQTVTSNADGILDLSFSAGQSIKLKWNGAVDTLLDSPLPVLSLYGKLDGAELSAAPEDPLALPLAEDFLTLPATFTRGHLQVLDLANWFAIPHVDSKMRRFSTRSRVQPLIDGIEALKLIADDMIACVPTNPAAPGNAPGAHFAGWGFKDLVLNPDLLDVNGDPYTFSSLIEHLTGPSGNGADVRVLVNRVIKVPGNLDNAVQINAILMTLLISTVILLASEFDLADSNSGGKLILFGSQLFSVIGATFIEDVNEILEELLDQSNEIFPILNQIKENIAIRSEYPGLNIDNPLFTPITAPTPDPITITDFIPGVGTWHQKIQLFKRAADNLDDRGNHLVAFLGGIDINANRFDNFGHQGSNPYHDVHARVTGPAAADVFQSWNERYLYDMAKPNAPANGLPPAFAPPLTQNMLVDDEAKHIVQIGRTLFKPQTPNSPHALPFALEGDTTINDNMIRAIREAREYIYIEDQYFVPNDSTTGNAYFDALLDAADHCKRLIILVPSILSLSEMPFGQERRANLINQLQIRWEDRVLIGAPLRRPVLPTSGKIALEGRCILFNDIGDLDTTIKLGPRARMPKAIPFWLWIEGELMLAVSFVDNNEIIDNHPVVSVEVIRGAGTTNPRWGAFAREHKKGAPITASQLRGIFVHAKIMMVDDIHVTIGSANLNRRGLFFDGEIGVFSIPEQLKNAKDNPARNLRTRLWAEQLGLPPTMGPALFRDPIAGFDLFHRHFFAGNRFMPLNLFDTSTDADVDFQITDNPLILVLANFGFGWFATHREEIWNTLVDPTTIADPEPTIGP